MPRNPPALVTPELLVWARKNYGLTLDEAADKLKVPPATLALWEAGQELPSLAQARRMAKLYKRPLSVFYLSELPRDFQAIKDYRRLASSPSDPSVSPSLKRQIGRAVAIRSAAIDLAAEQADFEYGISISIRYSDSPESVARRIRGFLQIDLKTQCAWRDPFQALKSWRSAVEARGTLVIQTQGISLHEMRACTVGGPPIPLIALNSKDTPRGKIFSLLHEFVHVQLHQEGLCRWDITESLRREERDVEAFCNHVAGAILVPRDDLLQHQVVRRHGSQQEWSDAEIGAISKDFSTSREVVLRRLLICGRTSPRFYAEKRAEFLAEAENRKDRGFVPTVSYARRVVNSLGNGYIDLVLASYYDRRITLSSVSDYLSVKLRHVPDIETEVMGWSTIGRVAV